VTGIAAEKKALQGMRFMPGELLYQVTDLSAVWVIADVAEQDIALVKTGAKARVTTTAYPTEGFEGRVTYVYPTTEGRDAQRARCVSNWPTRASAQAGDVLLQVELGVGGKSPVLTVPDSAVIDTGTRRIVLVQVGEGRFEPREVELGARRRTTSRCSKGVRDGEPVVVAANFLIDAESNLKAAVGGLGGHAGHGSPAPGAPRQRYRRNRTRFVPPARGRPQGRRHGRQRRRSRTAR
jgi:Cu(I)/Ag(I) efflux system membrane fusion protein